MKLNPIQMALMRLVSYTHKPADLAVVAGAMEHTADALHEMALETTDQKAADALQAGAMALVSLAKELEAGGQTEASDDYLQRAFAASSSYTLRTNTHEHTQENEDDDERMDRLQRQSNYGQE
jgi:hypothetical protein